MLRITREDYLTLESRIQAEIQKVLTQFLDDLEKKDAGPGETDTIREVLKPDPSPTSVQGGRTPDSAGPKRHRAPKKSVEVNRILYRTSHAGMHSPGKILEDDIAKIFRNRPRSGSHKRGPHSVK